ncbi:unnamed protein product, partial [Ectocarpus sp. 8 AP-2014]
PVQRGRSGLLTLGNFECLQHGSAFLLPLPKGHALSASCIPASLLDNVHHPKRVLMVTELRPLFAESLRIQVPPYLLVRWATALLPATLSKIYRLQRPSFLGSCIPKDR